MAVPSCLAAATICSQTAGAPACAAGLDVAGAAADAGAAAEAGALAAADAGAGPALDGGAAAPPLIIWTTHFWRKKHADPRAKRSADADRPGHALRRAHAPLLAAAGAGRRAGQSRCPAAGSHPRRGPGAFSRRPGADRLAGPALRASRRR